MTPQRFYKQLDVTGHKTWFDLTPVAYLYSGRTRSDWRNLNQSIHVSLRLTIPHGCSPSLGGSYAETEKSTGR